VNSFLDRLQKGVIVADGAMGSLLATRFGGEAPSLLARQILEVNLTDPALVREIHLRYIAAGAELIETNSFAASRPRLEKLGLDLSLVSEAAKIARDARDASGKPVWIAGSIGPLDSSWLLEEDPSPAEQARAFAEQIELLVDRGVDLILLETFANLSELVLAARAVRSVSSAIPFVAQMTFDERGYAASGEPASNVAWRMIDEGAAAVGANCGMGPQATLAVLALMVEASPPALSIMPNAGFAQRLGSRVIYPDMSPETYGAFALEARMLGARIIGGCCGTTPTQIAAIAAALARPDASRPAAGTPEAVMAARVHVAALPPSIDPHPDVTMPAVTEKASGLAKKLSSGEFVWSLQIDPQRGPSDQANREVVRAILEDHLVDLVDINSSGQGTRQDSLQIAAGIERMGVETLAHITPRDATVAGVLSQVIGAHDWGGIRNVLVISGDPPRGDFVAEAKGVYQVDTIGLVRAIDRLRRGQIAGGRTTTPPFQLLIGVAFNQNAPDSGLEVARLEEKVEAGADFVMTQPLFDVAAWGAIHDQLHGRVKIPVLAGVWPLASFRQAIRINENVSGVVVPESVLERLTEAGPREQEIGFALAEEVCRALEGGGEAAGVYVVAPFKQPRQALALFRARRQS
jgi:homocysteine S-methyltransferase